MEEIAKLKQDMLKLKAIAKTVGDSATAYQITAVLGDRPSSDNIFYFWSVEVEPLKNFENAIFTAEPTGGYMFQTMGGTRYPFINQLFPYVDINNPWKFYIAIYYYNPSYVEVHGDNTITITSNVPFMIKETNRRTIQLY